jgi:hypothetical protein
MQSRYINPVKKFLRYFWSPIPWMIEAAAVISAVISHWEDFWIIVVLLFLNKLRNDLAPFAGHFGSAIGLTERARMASENTTVTIPCPWPLPVVGLW